MNGLFSITGELARPVSWALFDSLWQGALVAAGLYLLLFLFRHQKPQLRYIIACTAMLAVLALTINSFVSYVKVTRVTETVASMESPSPPEAGRVATADPEGATGSQFSTPLTFKIRNALNPWLFFAWLTGVMFITLYHLAGWYRTRELLIKGVEEFDSARRDRMKKLIHKVGVKKPVRLVRSFIAEIPCVVGWVKPMVLIPAGILSGLTEDELEMIIIHELAHIRRHDVLINYLQAVMETLFFFNPAIWLISHRIRLEREHCCDDAAVKITGDKMKYVKALTNLEETRAVTAHLSPAAKSGPLLERIRRIVADPGPTRKTGSVIVNLISVIIIVGAVFTIQSILPDRATAEVNLTSTEVFEVQKDDIRGTWEIDDNRRDRQIRIEFRRRLSDHISLNWSYEELDLKSGDNARFKWETDAGTFFFEGFIEEEDGLFWGEGDCYFRASRDYMDRMRELGYNIKTEEKCLTLAVHNITLDFAEGFSELGYDLSLDRLVEFHIHGVTPEYVKEMFEMGYDKLSEDRLVEMKIHKVSPEFVRELIKWGVKDLSASELVTMSIHGVDPGYIKEFHDLGYDDFSSSKLVEMRIHGVSPGFVRDLQELGYENLSSSKLVEMQIHGVDLYFIKGLAELGYKDISPSKLVEMKIHNVSPYYIKELAEVGYNEIDPSKLVEMRIHGVDKSFIAQMQDRGYDLTPDELIEYKIQGDFPKRKKRIY